MNLIDQLRSWFQPKDRHIYLSDDLWILSQKVAWETAVSKFLALPGLVGFWPMSSVQRSTGQAYDLSGQARHLTYNGNPQYSIYNDIVPYLSLDGTGDFLSRADETDLDIQGNETIYAANVRGLTLGGWFWQNNLVSSQAFLGKVTGAGNQRSYTLFSNAGIATLAISNDGATVPTYTGSGLSANSWFFIVGRWVPNSTGDVFVNGVKTSTVSTVTSIFSGTSVFRVGDRGDGLALLNGRAGPCFLCANALSDDLISMLYEQSRRLFGVGA